MSHWYLGTSAVVKLLVRESESAALIHMISMSGQR